MAELENIRSRIRSLTGDDFVSCDGKRDVCYSRSCDFRDGHDLDSLQNAERNLDNLRQLFR